MKTSAARLFILFVLCVPAVLLAQTYPVPLVNTPVVPSSVSPGGHGFSLTVNGNGFTSSSRVLWNGSPRKTTFVSSIQLKANITSSDIATASTATIIVANPGKTHLSNPVYLQISTPEQAITVIPTSTNLTGGGIPLAADLNGDGIADLIVQEEFGVDVALGLGGGNFASPQVIIFTLPVSSLITGNFTGTGKPDIVAVLSDGVYIVPNAGNGTFGNPRKVISNNQFVASVAAADVNGDGLLDLLKTESDGFVDIYLRQLNGKFQKTASYPAGSSPNSVAIGDLNRDGFADLVVLNSDDSIAVFLGNGDGTFQPATFYTTGSQGDFPGPILVADFNGDGNLDVARAAANFIAGVGVLLGNGDGTLQPVQKFQTSSYGLVAGDFNSDGILDVATGLNSLGTGILLGAGNGTFQTLFNFDGFPTVGIGVTAADFDGNGRLDVASWTQNSGTSMVKLYLQ